METRDVIDRAVAAERSRQEDLWGQQNLPDGIDPIHGKPLADFYKEICELALMRHELSWKDVLLEEVYEALAEDDPHRLKTELVQVMAVCKAWIECIDRRNV